MKKFHYVYALIDPSNNNSPFYIGKGDKNRISDHFRGAPAGVAAQGSYNIGVSPEDIFEAADTRNGNLAKIQKIVQLRQDGFEPRDIARVVVRYVSEAQAFAVEACLIHSIYGFGNLKNIQPGHNATRFRPTNGQVQGPDLDNIPQEFSLANVLQSGQHYVYALRDPRSGQVFYVGKGIGKRIEDHFSAARSFLLAGQGATNPDDVSEKLQELSMLLEAGRTPDEIGHVLARGLTDEEALVLEALYIKFIYGRRQLSNLQAGHHSGLVRAQGDWQLRHGFDIACISQPGAPRLELLDQFLSEGIDTSLLEVADQITSLFTNIQFSEPRLVGAGELCIEASLDDKITLRIFGRSKLTIQVALVAKSVRQKRWLVTHFHSLEKFPYRRQDFVFFPDRWRGARNMTRDVDEAVRRTKILIHLAMSPTSLSDDEFDEAFYGLPSGRELTSKERSMLSATNEEELIRIEAPLEEATDLEVVDLVDDSKDDIWLSDPLGADVHIPGIDPDDSLSSAEQDDHDRRIGDWARGNGSPPDGPPWNTLPFGVAGECRDRLFVYVADRASIPRRLAETAKHLIVCPKTQLVVFQVGGDVGYLEWAQALNRFKSESECISEEVRFVTRLDHAWQPRASQRPACWQGGLWRAAQLDNGAPFPSLPSKLRAVFTHRIWLLEELGFLSHLCSAVNLHTRQPADPADGPDLSFGVAFNGKGSLMGWKARLYLPRGGRYTSNIGRARANMPLGFAGCSRLDLRRFNLAADDFHWSAEAWIAQPFASFLMDPYGWLDTRQLPDRRP